MGLRVHSLCAESSVNLPWRPRPAMALSRIWSLNPHTAAALRRGSARHPIGNADEMCSLTFLRSTMNTLALPARLSAKRSGAHHPLVTPVQSFLSPDSSILLSTNSCCWQAAASARGRCARCSPGVRDGGCSVRAPGENRHWARHRQCESLLLLMTKPSCNIRRACTTHGATEWARKRTADVCTHKQAAL